jgi:hypothetical protein
MTDDNKERLEERLKKRMKQKPDKATLLGYRSGNGPKSPFSISLGASQVSP